MNLMHLKSGDRVIRRDGKVETFSRWSPGETVAMFESGHAAWISDGRVFCGGPEGPGDILAMETPDEEESCIDHSDPVGSYRWDRHR